MKFQSPAVDYRKLRLNNLSSSEFHHLKLLLFWPVFGFLFYFTELYYPATFYYPVHCALDDIIPFFEWFLIPYLFWFPFLVGMHVFTLFYDVDTFRRMMGYIILTYSLTLVIYWIFPTCQELRPDSFARDNVLTRIAAAYYDFDTNTNVCPSIHVIGSLAVMEAALYSPKIVGKGWKWAFVLCAIAISISTVFMKQHSAVDIFAALPICLLGRILFFRRKKPLKKA